MHRPIRVISASRRLPAHLRLSQNLKGVARNRAVQYKSALFTMLPHGGEEHTR